MREIGAHKDRDKRILAGSLQHRCEQTRDIDAGCSLVRRDLLRRPDPLDAQGVCPLLDLVAEAVSPDPIVEQTAEFHGTLAVVNPSERSVELSPHPVNLVPHERVIRVHVMDQCRTVLHLPLVLVARAPFHGTDRPGGFGRI